MSNFGDRHRIRRTGNAEVGDLDRSVIEHQQVAGFHIAMDDAENVSGVKSLSGLGEQRQDGVDGDCTALSHHLRQRLAGDQLHDEICDTKTVLVVLAVIEDAGDTRVRERRSVSCLGPKALEEHIGIDEIVAQDLDRYFTMEHGIGSRPDLTHATHSDATSE